MNVDFLTLNRIDGGPLSLLDFTTIALWPFDDFLLALLSHCFWLRLLSLKIQRLSLVRSPMIIQESRLEISALSGKNVHFFYHLWQTPDNWGSPWFLDFQVISPLPNITFNIGTTYAGNIPVQRAGHPNNTLFFIGVEKTKGSLIAKSTPANRDPWGIWLNGGWF